VKNLLVLALVVLFSLALFSMSEAEVRALAMAHAKEDVDLARQGAMFMGLLLPVIGPIIVCSSERGKDPAIAPPSDRLAQIAELTDDPELIELYKSVYLQEKEESRLCSWSIRGTIVWPITIAVVGGLLFLMTLFL